MNIVMLANTFFPAIGGYETVSFLLSRELTRRGHNVCLVTLTPGDDTKQSFPFEVIRRPNFAGVFRRIIASDVYIQNNISLPYFWPRALTKTPLVVIHHGWYSQHRSGIVNWKGRTKFAATRLTSMNVAVSSAVAKHLPSGTKVIHNPFDDVVFVPSGNSTRPCDIIFVGRLVADKGCDLAIRAIRLLADRGIHRSLTIVGDGPERHSLQNLSVQLQVADRINFLGSRKPIEVAELLATHQISVIPSRWEEPFGVVALEALACGCAVVASRVGGLPEAVGDAGLLVEKDELVQLAAALEMLRSEPVRRSLATLAVNHIEQHRSGHVAAKYEALLHRVIA
jgi:glycogen(starch) synthase